LTAREAALGLAVARLWEAKKLRWFFPGHSAATGLGIRLGMAAVCAAGLLAPAGVAHAAVGMTASTAAPAVDALDQANLADDATIPGGTFNQQAFSDNAGPPGQTFTTPAGDPVTLRSISLKGANTGSGNSGGNVFTAGTTWSVRLSAVNGAELSEHKVWSGIPTVAGAQGNEWFTFTFTDNDALGLSANSHFAFEVFSSAGYLGFDAAANPASYASGFAFNTTGAARQFSSNTYQDRGYDRTFHVDLVAGVVPEPASAALLGTAAAALLMRRRRGRARV
jgi:hypothetical protein